MTPDPKPPAILQNQSVVRFSSGAYTGHAYSNFVHTPVVGPRITLIKSANAAEAGIGDVIAYQVSIVNEGNLDAQVTLFDTLPEGTAWVPNSVLIDGIPLPLRRPQDGIPLGLLRSGGTKKVSFQLIVMAPNATLQLKNQASVSYTFRTPSGRSASGSARSNTSVIPVQGPKVSVRKQADSPYTFVGDTVVYRLTVTNEGAQLLRNVRLQDDLPAGAAFVPGSVSIGRVYHPSLNPEEGIPLEKISPGESIGISFQVHISEMPPSGSLINRASLSYWAGEYTDTAFSEDATLQVFDPGIMAVLSVEETQATLGDPLHYTLTVVNGGNIAAELLLSGGIPEGCLFEWGSLAVNGRPVDRVHLPGGLPLGILEPHERLVVTYRARVQAFGTDVRTDQLLAQADIRYTFGLPDGRSVSRNIRTNTAVTGLLRPSLDIHMSADTGVTEPGGEITYRIRVGNQGNLAAGHVRLKDWIPARTAYIPGSMLVDGVSPGTGSSEVLELGAIGPQGSVEIIYRVRVPRHGPGPLITVVSAATYTYRLNGPIHNGSVRSNEVRVRVDERDE